MFWTLFYNWNFYSINKKFLLKMSFSQVLTNITSNLKIFNIDQLTDESYLVPLWRLYLIIDFVFKHRIVSAWINFICWSSWCFELFELIIQLWKTLLNSYFGLTNHFHEHLHTLDIFLLYFYCIKQMCENKNFYIIKSQIEYSNQFDISRTLQRNTASNRYKIQMTHFNCRENEWFIFLFHLSHGKRVWQMIWCILQPPRLKFMNNKNNLCWKEENDQFLNDSYTERGFRRSNTRMKN